MINLILLIFDDKSRKYKKSLSQNFTFYNAFWENPLSPIFAKLDRAKREAIKNSALPPHRPPSSSSLKLIEWKKEKEKMKTKKIKGKEKNLYSCFKKNANRLFISFMFMLLKRVTTFTFPHFFQMNFSDNCIYSFIAAKNHPFRKPAIFPSASLPPPSICTRLLFKINSPEFPRAATTSHWTVVIGKSVSSYFRSLNKSSSE